MRCHIDGGWLGGYQPVVDGSLLVVEERDVTARSNKGDKRVHTTTRMSIYIPSIYFSAMTSHVRRDKGNNLNIVLVDNKVSAGKTTELPRRVSLLLSRDRTTTKLIIRLLTKQCNTTLFVTASHHHS
jgi:hypothetical protein